MFSASVYPVDGAGDIFSGCLLGRGIPDQLAFDSGLFFSTCAGRQPVGISAQVYLQTTCLSCHSTSSLVMLKMNYGVI